MHVSWWRLLFVIAVLQCAISIVFFFNHSDLLRASSRNDRRVVISLATVPLNAAFLPAVLESLLDQSFPPDEIRVFHNSNEQAMPLPWRRLALMYPKQLRFVHVDGHFGRAVSFLQAVGFDDVDSHAAQEMQSKVDELVVICDDGAVYPIHWLESLVEGYDTHALLSGPSSRIAVGLEGWRVARNSNASSCSTPVPGSVLSDAYRVTVLRSVAGILMRKGDMKSALSQSKTRTLVKGLPALRLGQRSTDVLTSYMLSACGFARLVVPTRSVPLQIEDVAKGRCVGP